MSERYVRIVHLWVHKGQEEAFETFEREAARIMARHKGRIDCAVRLTPPPGIPADDATPYELHIVSFPDEAAFQGLFKRSGHVGFTSKTLENHIPDCAFDRPRGGALLTFLRSAAVR